jgi:hypothetical protein
MKQLKPNASNAEIVQAINELANAARTNKLNVGPGMGMQRGWNGTNASAFLSRADKDRPTATGATASPMQVVIASPIAREMLALGRWVYTMDLLTSDSDTGGVFYRDAWSNDIWIDYQQQPEAGTESDTNRRNNGYRFEAYNMIEKWGPINPPLPSGIERTEWVHGNGVDFGEGGSLASTAMYIQPCPLGCAVMCICSGGVWQFQYENGIDGSCSAEA